MTSTLLFMSYTPRADSDARGYEDWLRAVDNPFFNAQPAIAHYSNWKLEAPMAGFSHFDFMLLSPEASPGDLFGAPEVQQFVGGWTRRWGREPDGPPERNCGCCLMARQGGHAGQWADALALSLDSPAAAGETWRLGAELIGSAPFQTLTRRFLANGVAAAGGARAELIAAP